MRSRGVVAAATVLAFNHGLVSVADAMAPILGVAPEDQAKYAGSAFKCLDGSGASLPIQAVNDEFCDCADGSDEPGTGACAGQELTHFYCANEGSTPRRLYASRVGDGICDCCDGSDEASLAARRPSAKCKNDCAERGLREAEENKARLEKLKLGVAKREDIVKGAQAQREAWRKEIKELENALPALREKYEAAKAVANAEREAKAAAAAAAGNTSGVDKACMFRQTAGCTPDGPRESDNDKTCHELVTKGISGYCDCNGNGIRESTEQGYDCDGPERKCRDVCEEAAEDEAEEVAAAAAADEKPQVSEYAKWMEGAEEALNDHEEEGDAKVSEYAKWMEHDESSPQPEAKGAEPEAAAAAAADGKAADAGAPAKPSAEDEEKDAKKLVDFNEDKIKDLERNLEVLPEDHLGYASLMGKTLSKQYTDFKYKVEFFDKARQDHTSLGTFSKWTGPHSAVFEHGTMCWGGPERMLKVNFHCGIDEELTDVSEPSRCVYEANLVHSGACEPSEVEVLTSGNRVVGPRDEL